MLVERHHELGLLRDTFAECVAGNGRVVLISGGLATGKTALLNAFAEHVVEHGALLLAATGGRAEQTLRMGAVWQLFRSAPLPAEFLARVSRLIGTEGLATDAVHEICELLLELATDRPVVIAVDDVQFADTASLAVLRQLRRRIRSATLLVALTEWERPTLQRPLLRAEITRQPHRRVVLSPLSEAGVAELLSTGLDSLDAAAAARLARACYAIGGGNPFLTEALIEDQCRRLAGREGVAVGAAFRAAVLDCLHRWDPEFGRIAGGMAILGEHAVPELTGELISAQPLSVGQVLDVLTAAGLVESGRLRHAEIVATVLASMSPRERSLLHARAARMLHRTGVDASEVARHLLAADTVPGPWAVWPLRHAADQSVAEDARLAVRYLELAVRACTDDRERTALHAALARAAWRINPSVAALHLTPLHGALQAGELAWRDAVPVIRHLLWQGDLAAAAEQLRAVHASAGRADSRTAAELWLAGEWIYGRLRDRIPEGVRGLLTAHDGAAPACPWRRMATLNELWAHGATGQVVSVAERVLDGCLGEVLPEVAATALLALDDAGRRQQAMFWCEALLGEAARTHASTWQAVLGCVRAEIAWRRGDLVTARAQASAAHDLLHTQSWGVLIGFPLSILILVNTAMGRYDAAAEVLGRAVPDAILDTTFGLRYLRASGHYNLATGRLLTALDDFERCGALARRWGPEVPAKVPWRNDLAQAYLKLGMREQARALAAEQLRRPRAVAGPRARAVSLQVLAACGEPASHALALPARRSRRSPDLPGRTHGDSAVLATGASALSEAERKVATLAANGHSNREIGRELYITVSTVEQHLTRVYRKLNVSRRTDLLGHLAR